MAWVAFYASLLMTIATSAAAKQDRQKAQELSTQAKRTEDLLERLNLLRNAMSQ
jgi:K+-sensing histidine kinase KdpD